MANLNAFKEKVGPDVRALISHLLQKQEASSLLRACEEDAWRFIRSCRAYPSVDKRKILQLIDDFQEKFKIHGFPQKAKNLKLLVTAYSGIEWKSDEVKWGCLHLMILLSNRPTHGKEDDKPIQLPLVQPQTAQDFDWVAYLKEGCEKFDYNRAIDSDSPWESSEDELPPTTTERQTPPPIARKPPLPPLRPPEDEINGLLLEAKSLACDGLQLDWWNDPFLREEPQVKNSVSNYFYEWEAQAAKDPFSSVVLGETRVITLYKVLKDLVVALYKAESGYVIDKIGDTYRTREKLTISSLTPFAFSNFINTHICPYLPMIRELDRFQEEVLMFDSFSMVLPLTLKNYTYSWALSGIFHEYRLFLGKLHLKILKQEETVTLTSLVNEVKPWLSSINFLYNIHKEAGLDNWETQENWVVAIKLISVLYFHLGDLDEKRKLIAMKIFIGTIYPYLVIAGSWMSRAYDFDRRDEFIIKPDGDGLVVRDYNSKLLDLGMRKCEFLDAITPVLKSGFKSIQLYVILEREFELWREILPQRAIFDEFIDNLCLELLGKNLRYCLSDNSDKEDDPSPCSYNDLEGKHIFGKHPNLIHSKDFFIIPGSLMDQAFELCNKQEPKPPPSVQIEFMKLLEEKTMGKKACTTLFHFAVKSVAPKSIAKYLRPKGFVEKIFLEDLHLMDNLDALFKVFLIRSKGMYVFALELFEEIDAWDHFNWLYRLHDILYREMPNEIIDRFSVSFLQFNLSNTSVMKVCTLMVDFTPERALSYVITEKALQGYKKILRLYLQVIWCLKQLQNSFYDRVSGRSETSIIKRLYVLRLWLFHTVSSLNNYFMSIDTDELKRKISDACSKSGDVVTISSIHEQTLEEWKAHCFLSDGHPCGNIVKRIFDVVELWSEAWKSYVKNFYFYSQISNLEREYLEVIRDLVLAFDALDSSEESEAFSYLKTEIHNNIPGIPQI